MKLLFFANIVCLACTAEGCFIQFAPPTPTYNPFPYYYSTTPCPGSTVTSCSCLDGTTGTTCASGYSSCTCASGSWVNPYPYGYNPYVYNPYYPYGNPYG